MRLSIAQRRLAFVLAGGAVLAALFVVLRDGHEASRPAASPPPSTRTTPTTSTRPTTRTTPPPQARATRIGLMVRGGRVVGGIRRITTRKGGRLVLVVRSDVADEVHIHGYDLSEAVAFGAPAEFSFRTTVPGRFEIELEERGLPIADLQVRP